MTAHDHMLPQHSNGDMMGCGPLKKDKEDLTKTGEIRVRPKVVIRVLIASVDQSVGKF